MKNSIEDKKTLQAHRLQWLNPNTNHIKNVKQSSREICTIQINVILRE